MENEKKAVDAAAILFKRLYGVKPVTFKKMLSIPTTGIHCSAPKRR
jgi:hypothetical protein